MAWITRHGEIGGRHKGFGRPPDTPAKLSERWNNNSINFPPRQPWKLLPQPHRSIYSTVRVDNKYPSSVHALASEIQVTGLFDSKEPLSSCGSISSLSFLAYEGHWRSCFREGSSEFEGTKTFPPSFKSISLCLLINSRMCLRLTSRSVL